MGAGLTFRRRLLCRRAPVTATCALLRIRHPTSLHVRTGGAGTSPFCAPTRCASRSEAASSSCCDSRCERRRASRDSAAASVAGVADGALLVDVDVHATLDVNAGRPRDRQGIRPCEERAHACTWLLVLRCSGTATCSATPPPASSAPPSERPRLVSALAVASAAATLEDTMPKATAAIKTQPASLVAASTGA
eukprot:4533569-Pleurochrysis_carterae.AAC.1